MFSKTPSRNSSIVILTLFLTLILAGQRAASYAISVSERPLGAPELRLIPSQTGDWQQTDEQVMEQNVLAYLQPDDYLLRNYVNRGSQTSINLFVAFFKSLQNSYGPHSPRVCLPGAGWLIQSGKIVSLPVPGRPEGIPVNEYILEKNGQRILVLYWYQNNRRIWAEEFQAKLNLLPDLIKHRRTDVSLVRLTTSLGRDEAMGGPSKAATDFARQIFPSVVERLNSIN